MENFDVDLDQAKRRVMGLLATAQAEQWKPARTLIEVYRLAWRDGAEAAAVALDEAGDESVPD